MKVNGGAIYSKNSNMTAFNTLFNGNEAVQGGAIFPDCSNGFICTFSYTNVSFTNNWAIVEGGAY